MASKYKVLEQFSEEARRRVAERNFAKRQVEHDNGERLRLYACERGLCVLAALMQEDGIDYDGEGFPNEANIANALGIQKYTDPEDTWSDLTDDYRQVYSITRLNDQGKLRTNKAVRALLLGEE